MEKENRYQIQRENRLLRLFGMQTMSQSKETISSFCHVIYYLSKQKKQRAEISNIIRDSVNRKVIGLILNNILY